MIIDRIKLVHLSMPLKHPFRTSFGLQTERECILVTAFADGLAGWGECVAMSRPAYSYETIGTAWHVLADYLIPAVLGKAWDDVGDLVELTAWVRGHLMAKAALQGAAWDLLAQRDGVSLATKLAEPYPEGPRARDAVGVSIGIQPTIADTLERIEKFLTEGYGRVKLKIEPGRDRDLAQAARKAFPAVPIMLDANSAYRLDDAALFRQMDDLDLLMIEQPLAHDDIYEHSQLQAQLETPICLDESVETSSQAAWALAIDAGRVINIKPGRVGGLWEARQIHDLCRARGVPVWCGGMLETGIGRAANLALASLPNFTLPSDISATDRYWDQDIIEERFVLNIEDSTITVPDRLGLGVTVDQKAMGGYQLKRRVFQLGP
jgi:O-succinylbenzoate synthase